MSTRLSRMGPCSLDGCDRKKYCAGLCSGHYKRLKRFGDPNAGLPIGEHPKLRDPEYVIGEIEWFIECGVSLELTMQALGYTKRDSLIKALRRWDRDDLADLFVERGEGSWFNQWLDGEYRVA